MQIPQNILNILSAKGRGYIEATNKLITGQKMVNEAVIELAALDGKKTALKAGGLDVTNAVRDLARPKITPEYLKTFLKEGPLTTRELATKAGCAHETARRALNESDVPRVGSGNQIRWTLTPAKSAIVKRTVANKISKRPKAQKGKAKKAKAARKADRERYADPADPAQMKKDQDRIIEMLKDKPGTTKLTMMKKLKRSFYPVTRAIDGLVEDGRLKPMKVKLDSGRGSETWEITSGGA